MKRKKGGIKGAFNTFVLVYEWPVLSTACQKAREAVVLLLLIGAFTVTVTNNKIVRTLQQSAMTGYEGVGMQRKRKRE